MPDPVLGAAGAIASKPRCGPCSLGVHRLENPNTEQVIMSLWVMQRCKAHSGWKVPGVCVAGAIGNLPQ